MDKLAVVGLALVASFLAEATPFRTIQRIWAVSPEKIEAAMAQYPGAFSDGIIIATFAIRCITVVGTNTARGEWLV